MTISPATRRRLHPCVEWGFESGDAAFLGLGSLTVVAACLLTLPVIGGNAWFSWDSAVLVARATEYMRLPFSPSFQSLFVESLFGFPFPINFHLLPEYLLSFRSDELDPVLFFLIASLLMFVACYWLARTFDFPPATAMASGLVLILLGMPVKSPPLYSLMFWWTGPHWLPTIYTFPMMVLIFHALGRRQTATANVAHLLAFVMLVIWYWATMTKVAVVVMLGLSWFLAIFILLESSWKAAAWKIVALAGLGAVFVFLGPLDFFRGMAGFSKNSLFIPALQIHGLGDFPKAMFFLLNFEGLNALLGSWVWLSLIAGYPLLAAAAVGIVLVFIERRLHPFRWNLALPTFLTVLCCLPSNYGPIVLGALYSILVLFGVHAAIRLVQLTARPAMPFIPRIISSSRFAIIALVVCVAVAWLAIGIRKAPIAVAFRYPPATPALVQTLKQDIGLPIGGIFKGRFVNLAFLNHPAIRKDGYVTSAALEAAGRLAGWTGNDMMMPGLVFHQIPYLFGFNRMGSPISLIFFSYLLGDRSLSNRVDFDIITRVDPRLMALLGARYVLADRDLPAPFRIMKRFDFGIGENLQLYALDDFNYGQWSPVRVDTISDYRQELKRLDDPAFNPKMSAIVPTPWLDSSDLVPAIAASIERVSDGLRIRGSSAGKSLLVLPIEFSRCLRIAPESAAPPTGLGRADFILTGAVFERHADFVLTFKVGIFENSGCRLADMLETAALTKDDFKDFVRREFSNEHPFVGLL
jgi:hypothetical protein